MSCIHEWAVEHDFHMVGTVKVKWVCAMCGEMFYAR